MKSLYNSDRSLPPILQWIGAFLCGTAYVVCCLPSFYRIGHFTMQIVSAVALSFVCTAALYFLLPRSLPILGRGLSLFLVVMLIYALVEQIEAQIQSGAFQMWWLHTFFYDRPLTVSIVWGTAFVSILLLRLFVPYSERYAAFREDFSRFYQTAFRVFFVFYICVLLYCFVLQRKPGGESGLNLIPFSMFFTYLQLLDQAYESSFYLIGNLLCFLPFGFYFCIRKKPDQLIRILFMPILISLLIEISQLLLGTGDFDVDDVWMNAVGFYAGYGIALLFDFVRGKITAGEETTIFAPIA